MESSLSFSSSVPRRTERDNAMVGFNLACAGAGLIGLGAFATALTGGGEAWLTATPWMLVGVGSALMFLIGLFAAPKMKWHGLGAFRGGVLAVFAVSMFVM